MSHANPPHASDKPGAFQTWKVALRLFALPASTMPVIFGTVLAVTVGGAAFHLALFLAAFFGMVLLHSGANLLNDVYDYKKGLDRHVHPGSGAVVREWITPRQGMVAGWGLLLVGSLLGLWIVSQVGLPVLWLGLIGVAIGVAYSWGPEVLKVHALGDLAVFLNFGVLGALGAWTVQTGQLSWVPALWAVPMALLVSGILHANNWRDIQGDRGAGVRTVANLLGDNGSQTYYGLLLFGPFALVLLFIASSWLLGLGPRMPLTFLVVFAALPLAVKLMRKGAARHAPATPVDFVALDAATGQLNLAFGLLCTVALGLDAGISHFFA